MKIIIFNWRDIKNPLSGGAEISLFEHAKYWRKKGADVTWFAASYKNAKAFETVEGIKTFRKGSMYTVHLNAAFYYTTGKLGTADIIIDSFHGLPFFSIFYISRKKVIALINEIAGRIWFVNTNIFVATVGFIIEKISLLLYKPQLFITGSESTKKELIKTGYSAETITVVHHGTHILNIAASIKKGKKPVVTFLGRVTEDKGIKDALNAYVHIKKSIPHARLWIAGGEERKGILDELTQKLSKEDKKGITYYGFVDEKTKFKLLKESWILVHPSIKEGWGLTVIEAASQGVPTVGYKVAGLIDSVQDGKTGILVKPKNTEKLAEAAITLIKNKNTYKKFSENAVQWSKQFTWDKSVKKSWEILKEIHEKNIKN